MTSVWRIFCLALSAALIISCGESGVTEFGPLKVGKRAPFGPGDPTSHPYKFIPVSNFYIYVVARKLSTMCVFDDCGVNGDVVERMGGWLTGDEQAESAEMVGLDQSKVLSGEDSMIVVADKNVRIIGIYPNHKMIDLLTILKRHPELGEIAPPLPCTANFEAGQDAPVVVRPSRK